MSRFEQQLVEPDTRLARDDADRLRILRALLAEAEPLAMVPALKARGGTDIIVTSLNQIVP